MADRDDRDTSLSDHGTSSRSGPASSSKDSGGKGGTSGGGGNAKSGPSPSGNMGSGKASAGAQAAAAKNAPSSKSSPEAKKSPDTKSPSGLKGGAREQQRAPQTGPAGPVAGGNIKSAVSGQKVGSFVNRAQEAPAPTRFKDPGVAGVPGGIKARNQGIFGEGRLMRTDTMGPRSTAGLKPGEPFGNMKASAIANLVSFADRLRAKGKRTPGLTSTWRSQATQDQIKAGNPLGVLKGNIANVSQHTEGFAVDLSVPGMTPAEVAKEALAHGGFGRIRGYGPTGHVHLSSKMPAKGKAVVSGSFGPKSGIKKGTVNLAAYADKTPVKGFPNSSQPKAQTASTPARSTKTAEAIADEKAQASIAAKAVDPRGLMANAPRPRDLPSPALPSALSRNPFDVGRGVPSPMAGQGITGRPPQDFVDLGVRQPTTIASSKMQDRSATRQGTVAKDQSRIAATGKEFTDRIPATGFGPKQFTDRIEAEIPTASSTRSRSPFAGVVKDQPRSPVLAAQGPGLLASPNVNIGRPAAKAPQSAPPMAGAVSGPALQGFTNMSKERVAARREMAAIASIGKSPTDALKAPQTGPAGPVRDLVAKAAADLAALDRSSSRAPHGLVSNDMRGKIGAKEAAAEAVAREEQGEAPTRTAQVETEQPPTEEEAIVSGYMDAARKHRILGQPKQIPTKPVDPISRKVLETIGGLMTGLPLGTVAKGFDRLSVLANQGRIGNRPGQPYALGSSHAIAKAFEGKGGKETKGGRTIRRRPNAAQVASNPFVFPTGGPVFPVS
jgi:hypothetical protein